MATGYFKCADCGEQVKVYCSKNRKETDRYCEWLESQERLCDECEEKKRKRENEEAAKNNADSGLPPLSGSAKQISWAESIRENKFKHIRQALSGELDGFYFEAFWGSIDGIMGRKKAMSVDDPNVQYTISLLEKKDSARWWIDNREQKIGFILADLFIDTPPKQQEQEDVSAARHEVESEATIRPESPLTETIAEIRVLDAAVEIDFPEKRDDFWQIVKKRLGYSWSGSCWRRDLDVIVNGSARARAAEAGNTLLAAGFIIRVFDEDARSAAISADFQPECTRWVYGRKKGTYQGWLALNWQEKNDSLYSAARRLAGSRWDKPSVVVPPEHFDEVLDFSGVHGFGITPSAQKIIDSARDTRIGALVAKPEKPQKHDVPASGRPDLDPTTAGDIDADLLDN